MPTQHRVRINFSAVQYTESFWAGGHSLKRCVSQHTVLKCEAERKPNFRWLKACAPQLTRDVSTMRLHFAKARTYQCPMVWRLPENMHFETPRVWTHFTISVVHSTSTRCHSQTIANGARIKLGNTRLSPRRKCTHRQWPAFTDVMVENSEKGAYQVCGRTSRFKGAPRPLTTPINTITHMQ